MLGIIIGVLSVVSMLAIGEGAKKYMEYSLRKMGSNMFHVQTERPYSTNATKSKVRYSRLTVEDLSAIESLRSRSGMIKNVSPVIQDRVSISYLGNSLDTRLEGVGVDYENMRGNTPLVGRFFTSGENDQLEKVCLLGQSVYRELFENRESPVGSLVEISGRKFTVIELLPSKGASWGDSDDVVLVPYKTAMKRLTGAKYFTNIFVQSVDESTLDPTMELVTSTLRKSHRIPDSAVNDFKIKNYSEIRETIESATQTMANFIGIVALISLVVGGIGIMNIMLVSVTERTREIGIRKAIGARSRDILFQFLAESCLIGALGGILGIFLAFLLGFWMGQWMGWDVEFRFYSIAMSFSFAMLVGIGFGLYPANKAAKLSPINALRYE